MGGRGASADTGKFTAMVSIKGATKNKTSKEETAKVEKVVAMAAILRDYAEAGKDYEYFDDRHKKMADIADTLYNANIGPDNFKPEYKKLYNEYKERYGNNFWSNITKRMGKMDDTLTSDTSAANRFGGTSILGQYNKIISEEKKK